MPSLVARISDLAASIRTKMNTKLDASAYIKGLSSFCAGKPLASEILAGAVSPYALTLSAANSAARAGIAATAQTIFVVKRGGTQIGTVTFAASATTGTISISSSAVAAGDHLTINAPAVPDATLADIAFLLRA